MIVIVTHAVFFNNKDIYGPPHSISLFLNKKKVKHLFIKHRLDSNGYSKIEFYRNGKLVKSLGKGYRKRLVSPFQYLLEFLITFKTIYSIKNCELFIGVDPLNAFAGIILKLFGKTKKTIYFSADFAIKRFNNNMLNSVYLLLDYLSMKFSDKTWSVSERIVNYRKGKRLKDKKNILVPNSPSFKSLARFRKEKKSKDHLVIVSRLYAGIGFGQIFLALKRLIKTYPHLKLHIVGDGEDMDNLIKDTSRLNLKENIIFYGARDHDFVYRLIAKSYIGFAPYLKTNVKDFRYFSDSMKIRDYLACGVPVIATGNTITGYEVRNKRAGMVIDLNESSIYESVYNLLKTPSLYEEIRKNALSLARERDIESILQKELKLYL